MGWPHLKSASPSTGRCVQLTTGKSHFQHRTSRRHLSSCCQNSRRWVAVKPTRHLAVAGAATWPPFPVFISESSFQSPSSFQHVNVDGTKVLLGAAYRARHRLRRFIYVSTDEVYGASTDQVSRRGFIWQAGGPQSHCDRLVLLRRCLMRAVQWGHPILILLPKQLQSSWSHPTGTNIRLTRYEKNILNLIWASPVGLDSTLYVVSFCLCVDSFLSSLPEVTTFTARGSTPRRYVPHLFIYFNGLSVSCCGFGPKIKTLFEFCQVIPRFLSLLQMDKKWFVCIQYTGIYIVIVILEYRIRISFYSWG